MAYGGTERIVHYLTGELVAMGHDVTLHASGDARTSARLRPGQAPTQYPVACSPQAWASAAAFSLLRAVLGLSIDAAEARVTFRHPFLPPFIEYLTIRNLRVGPGAVDLRLRYPEDVGLTVTRTTGQRRSRRPEVSSLPIGETCGKQNAR